MSKTKKMVFVERSNQPKTNDKELVISLLEIVYNIDWKILQVFGTCLSKLYHDIEIKFSIIELCDLIENSNNNILKNKLSNKNVFESIIKFNIAKERSKTMEKDKIKFIETVEAPEIDDFDDIEYKNKILEYAHAIDWKLWEILQILQRQEKNSSSTSESDEEEKTLDDIFNIKENKEE